MWPRTMADLWPHVFCHVEGDEEMLTVKTEAGNEQSRFNEAEVKQVVRHISVILITILKSYQIWSTSIQVCHYN